MFCTNCGAQNEPGTSFCTRCGAKLAADAVPPPSEGVPPLNAGQVPPPVPPPASPPSVYVPPGPGVPYQDPTARSKLVAGLLGIFLGWLGIHRFYLGYNNIAIAQLVVGVIGLVLSPFTCGLVLLAACIWGIIDGVMILTGSINRDGQGKPLRD